MTITLTGTNSFLIRSDLKQLIDTFTRGHGDLALEKLDGEEASYEQILGTIESLPFLAAKKMVVVQDLSANKQASEALEQLIGRAGDTTELIIVESNVDKRGTYYKQLKKLTDFREYKEQDEAGLTDWLMAQAKAKGSTLNKPDAMTLVQRVGANQMKLSHELDKLTQYDPNISRQSIELLTDESSSSTIFNLIDSVFSGNLAAALNIYDEQRRLRVEPQAIHGMMVWQMHAVAILASAPTELNSGQIAQESGISPFVIQKSQRIARRMSRAKIAEFMKLLRDIDYRGKHETLDYDEAMRYAIVSLA